MQPLLNKIWKEFETIWTLNFEFKNPDQAYKTYF